jgi:riboflavin synthase
VFSGIVEDVATVERTTPLAAGRRLVIRTGRALDDLVIGESIALDGACMTLVSSTGTLLEFDVSAESLRRTTLGEREPGDSVNLERSLRLADRLGGHLVTGHVDGKGRIVSIRPEGESFVYRFEIALELARRLVEKGSVAVDGISLTCYDCRDGGFSVAVIPHTAAVTTLGRKREGASVNIETDLLAKYVEKLLEPVLGRR